MTRPPTGPAAGRVIGARGAAELAKVAGLHRHSTRAVLALLLRLSRPGEAVERSVRWIAADLGYASSTTRAALDELKTAGLVGIDTAGGGRVKTAYVVNVAALVELAGGGPKTAPKTAPVHPGETVPEADPAPASRVPVIGTLGAGNRHPGCRKSAPWVPVIGTLYAGGRARGRLYPPFNLPYPLTPDTPDTSPPGPESSPAGGGAPFPISNEKCPHGRTLAQGGCRQCQTNARAAAKLVNAATKAADLDAQRRDQAAKLKAAELDRANSKPAPDTLRADLRAARRAKP